MEEKISYTQAVTELEQIVSRMQSEDCDIDRLAAYTKRALELLKICKQRLHTVDEELQRSLQTLG